MKFKLNEGVGRDLTNPSDPISKIIYTELQPILDKYHLKVHPTGMADDYRGFIEVKRPNKNLENMLRSTLQNVANKVNAKEFKFRYDEGDYEGELPYYSFRIRVPRPKIQDTMDPSISKVIKELKSMIRDKYYYTAAWRSWDGRITWKTQPAIYTNKGTKSISVKFEFNGGNPYNLSDVKQDIEDIIINNSLDLDYKIMNSGYRSHAVTVNIKYPHEDPEFVDFNW